MMRASGWLAGLALALAAAPAPAQQVLPWGAPVGRLQFRVVNTAPALNLPNKSNVPIALPYVTSPQHNKLSLDSFLPTGVGRIGARPTHGASRFPTPSQMPNLKTLTSPFGIRTGGP